MGCSIPRSEIELKINEIWDQSDICLMNIESYIRIINHIVNEKLSIKSNIKKEDLKKEINEEVTNKVLISFSNEDLFKKIRFHLKQEDNKQNNGYFLLFAMILLTQGKIIEKIQAFDNLFLILQEPFELKGKLTTNISFMKGIFISYIDLVSFITLGYLINLNKNNDTEYLEKLMKISKCFRLENRTLLCGEVFKKWELNSLFNMENFLKENEQLLLHSGIRDKLVELDHGVQGLYNEEKKEKENLGKKMNEEKKENENLGKKMNEENDKKISNTDKKKPSFLMKKSGKKMNEENN